MSVGKLIDFFSRFTKLPIYAEDVRDQIVEMGIQDVIEFHPIDVDPKEMLGMYFRFRHRTSIYGDPQNISVIFYNSNVDPNEQNFICCKELMHVFDDSLQASVTNSEALQKLITTLFQEAPDPAKISIGGFMDLAAEFVALAIMFPGEVRDQFKEALEAGQITLPQIAEILGIPEKYISDLLSSRWQKLLGMLRGL